VKGMIGLVYFFPQAEMDYNLPKKSLLEEIKLCVVRNGNYKLYPTRRFITG
jgi:hypothetical protein